MGRLRIYQTIQLKNQILNFHYNSNITLTLAHATEELVGLAILRQNGLCPICHYPLGLKWTLDHDHMTGLFRGVLHRSCNGMEGIYRNWKQYLERPNF